MQQFDVVMLWMFGSDVGHVLRSVPMTRRTFECVCQCCGVVFTPRHPAAKWCSSRCKTNGRYYARDGRPVPSHHRASALTIVQDPDELPLAWRLPLDGHEVRTWGGTAIARRESDGYINATAMCHANSRDFFDYQRLDRTRDYGRALAAATRSDSSNLIRSITTGPNDLRGTWIHPRLAVDLARWISPQFAVWMDGWFLEAIAQPKPISPAPLPHGVHVVATSKRHAYWLWMTAVESEVGAALMRNRHGQTAYQLHLSA